jgi:exonuclease SbcC
VSSDKHLVRDGQNHMEVKLEFEFGDHLIKITRGYRMNKSFAVLRVDGKQIAEGTRNVNQAIIDLIKMNFDVFVATTFFIQDGLDTFSGAIPSERKRMLTKILELTAWSTWHNLVNKKLKKLKVELEDVDREIKFIVGTYDLERDYDADIRKLENNHRCRS